MVLSRSQCVTIMTKKTLTPNQCADIAGPSGKLFLCVIQHNNDLIDKMAATNSRV